MTRTTSSPAQRSGGAVHRLITPGCAHSLARTTFKTRHAGEAKLALTAWARGTDWGTTGRESAVLSVAVDGREATSVVTFNGAAPLEYRVVLGRVRAGRHEVTVSLDRAKSPVGSAEVRRLKVLVGDDLVSRFAPILYGRDLPEIPGRYENATTDVPLLAYHTSSADPATGDRTIEYTTIWSNEDGGTNTPALMARWGRTTDGATP